MTPWEDNTPDWFDFKKYEGVRNLTAGDFYRILQVRSVLIKSITLGHKPYAFFDVIKDKPLTVDFSDNVKNQIDPDSSGEFSEISCLNKNLPIVNPIVRLDYIDIKRNSEGVFHIVSPQSKNDINLSVQSLMDGYIIPLFVDLTAGRNVIEATFKDFIKKAKRGMFSGKDTIPLQGFDSEIKRIDENRVLQYLDVKAWFLMNSEECTHEDFAYILFPENPVKGGENVRKTTKKKADLILTRTYQDWLLHENGKK